MKHHDGQKGHEEHKYPSAEVSPSRRLSRAVTANVLKRLTWAVSGIGVLSDSETCPQPSAIPANAVRGAPELQTVPAQEYPRITNSLLSMQRKGIFLRDTNGGWGPRQIQESVLECLRLRWYLRVEKHGGKLHFNHLVDSVGFWKLLQKPA